MYLRNLTAFRTALHCGWGDWCLQATLAAHKARYAFGLLVVQGRYKESRCLGVLKRLLRYMQSDRCPLSSFICNFHGGNTGSNPSGTPNLFRDLERKS